MSVASSQRRFLKVTSRYFYDDYNDEAGHVRMNNGMDGFLGTLNRFAVPCKYN